MKSNKSEQLPKECFLIGGILPEGWKLTELAELCSKITDGTHVTPKYTENGIPFISTSNINPFKLGLDFSTYKKFISVKDHIELTKRCKPERGDLLISKCGTIGRSKLVDVDYEFSIFVGLGLIKIKKDYVSGKFLEFILNSDIVQKQLEQLSPGSTRKTLPINKIGKIKILLPPLAEQHRIVASIESLLFHVNASRDRLDRVPGLLKVFRQAVLAAACSGNLTEGWRKEHDIIQKTSWKSLKLQDIGKWSTGGTPSRKIKSFFNGDIPWIKSGDLKDGIITDPEEKISKEGLYNSNAKLLPVGTVSIALYGATIGKVGILGIEAATNQACANCIVKSDKILNKYLLYYLVQQRQKFIDVGQGGAQPNLTNKIVHEWPIYSPTLPEQHEIVRRVESLFALAERIEQRVVAGKERADRLTQAILAKAFRGELVPTEAELASSEGREFESAGVLLERIRKERESQGEGKPRKKKVKSEKGAE